MATHNGLSEDDLCAAFADAVRDFVEFRVWVLSRTKFAGYARTARVLSEEQMSLRPRKQWWRHWWSFVPELGVERETDIFMTFDTPSDFRFALHFETKLGTGSFQKGQAQGYQPGARFMANKDEYMNYSDFQTALISTRDFRERYPDEVRCFDLSFPFDEIVPFVIQFGHGQQ